MERPEPRPQASSYVANTAVDFLQSHARPPWYTQDGKLVAEAFVIGIAGGSASGKTHVARQIVKQLGNIPSVVILSQDSFYNPLTPEQSKLAFDNQFDFDHPAAIDSALFANCLRDLKACKQTNVPIYSFTQHQRLPETEYLYGAAIIIAEGIMALTDPALRDLYDLKLFVQCDSDIMLARRLRRDVAERGRSVGGVLDQYLRFVKPSYDNFVLPTSKFADIIVPGQNNSVAIDLITTHVRKMLQGRAASFRQSMARAQELYIRSNSPQPCDGVIALEQTAQLRGINTILRDKNTHRSDFIFYADRLATLVIEKAMESLPFRPKTVVTPTGVPALGHELATSLVCGVSIIRSGGPLERGLTRVLRDVRLGALIIQTDKESGDPMLLHSRLPSIVRNRETAETTYVFLLDSQIATGAAALMAIRILVDHGVRPDHIIFAAFVVARGAGINTIQEAFPGVRIVTGSVDDKLVESWVGDRRVWDIEPGMGHIGDRYYL